MGSALNWEQSMLYTKSWQVLHVFDMQKRNRSTERVQRVDEKHGVIRLVIFTPRVMVIKISEMAHFMYFQLDTAKYQSQFGQ